MPQKQEILDRVLADEPKTSSPRSRRLMPVAAAASIALVAGGVLAVPALTKSGNEGVAPADRTRTEQTDGLRVRRGIPIDLGPLTQAQASQLAKECAKWIGSKDLGGGREYPLDWPGAGAGVDAVLHAVVVRSGWEPNSSDWTVAIKSGGQIYACVGHPTRKGPDGRTIRGYDFASFGRPGKQNPGTGTALGGTITLDQKVDRLVTDRWLKVAPGVASVRQRFVMKGKPGEWFTTKVVDGLAYIRAWDASTALRVGDRVQLETQLLDKSDHPLNYPGTNGKTHVQPGTVTPHFPPTTRPATSSSHGKTTLQLRPKKLAL